MMDDLTQVAHIAAGMNVTIDRAIALVAAANRYASGSTAPVTIGNVIVGADFNRRKPREALRRTL